MRTDNLVERAEVFARCAHANQLRKYTNDLYTVHPEQMVGLLMQVHELGLVGQLTDQMIAATWLHDTVEDTPATLEEIREDFGDEVADLVFWLTDTLTHTDGNRAFRKEAARKRLAEAPMEAQIIKAIDLMHNAGSIALHDPDFWKVFDKEAQELLAAMTKVPRLLRASADVVFETCNFLSVDAQKK